MKTSLAFDSNKPRNSDFGLLLVGTLDRRQRDVLGHLTHCIRRVLDNLSRIMS